MTKELNSQDVEIEEIDISKLLHENETLKNRCRVLSQGTLCIFCPMECKHRTNEFRGDLK